MGFQKSWEGLKNIEIQGAPFVIRPPNFSRGVWIFVIKMQSPGFKMCQNSKNFLPAAGHFSLFLHSYYFNFQKTTCQQRAFTHLLLIFVVTNTINVKNNISIHEEIEGIPFFKGVDFHK